MPGLLRRSEVVVIVINCLLDGVRSIIGPSPGLKLSFATHDAPCATSSDSGWSGTPRSCLRTLNGPPVVDCDIMALPSRLMLLKLLKLPPKVLY